MLALSRGGLALSIAVVIGLLPVTSSHADHSDGVYELPAIAQWKKTKLNVLVVPPNHGQIFNGDRGLLNGTDPNELTPFNSYLRAIEASIGSWKTGVDTFASDRVKQSYDVRVYVIGRDSIPPEVVTNPDILVFTDESQATMLGVAVRVVPCLVRVSKLEIESFSYADMFNVMGQEFGHCLGLSHVGSQGGVDPTSDLKHPEHDIMNGFYTHFAGAKGTHLHCISNLDILALEHVFTTVNPSVAPSGGPSKTTYMPVSAYGTTCEPPPADWRRMSGAAPAAAPATPGPSAAPSPASSPRPEPGSSPSAAPTHSPSAAPSASPTPAPSPSQSPSSGTGSEVDPPAETTIENPVDGAKLPRRSLDRVSGRADGETAGTRIQVALARRLRSGGCGWWTSRTERFVKRSCTAPRWNRASGVEEWSLTISSDLPAGRYRAFSRARSDELTEECCHRGDNMVDFRLI